MSALGQKQTFAVQNVMSALPPTADIGRDLCEAPVLKDGRQYNVGCRRVSFDLYFQAISEAASSLDIGSYRPVPLSLGRTLGRTLQGDLFCATGRLMKLNPDKRVERSGRRPCGLPFGL